jgi:hypothetical protein
VDGAAERPVVGLFGAFDTGEIGEIALRRVIERELRRRRPDIDLIAIAPFGVERPIPGDEGRPAMALDGFGGAGLPTLDALIITGDVLGDDEHWAGRYPVPVDAMSARGVAALVRTGSLGGRPLAPSVTWFAVGSQSSGVDAIDLQGHDVWARNLAVQERLGGTAVQSGDPLLLTGRVVAPEVLRRRTDLLRLCGAIPAGRRLVVETTPDLVASGAGADLVNALGVALRTDPKLSVVVLTLDPTRQPTAGSMLTIPGLIAERVHHLPDWVGLDDLAATISGAVAVVASSPAGAHLAAAFGVPASVVDIGLAASVDPAVPVLAGDLTPAIAALVAGKHPAPVEAAVQTLDGAFAELAERLPRAAGSPRAALEPDAGTSALAILQHRLVDERTALQAELSRIQSELDHLRALPEHRLAQPFREGYRRWQRRRT